MLSSSSYSMEENFSELIRALDIVDTDAACPKWAIIATGKGVTKSIFEDLFKEANAKWKKTSVHMVFLDVDDYPKVVASADIGVCLHYSSSGVDLPMKVVDMFSAGVPVICKGGYRSLSELV